MLKSSGKTTENKTPTARPRPLKFVNWSSTSDAVPPKIADTITIPRTAFSILSSDPISNTSFCFYFSMKRKHKQKVSFSHIIANIQP